MPRSGAFSAPDRRCPSSCRIRYRRSPATPEGVSSTSPGCVNEVDFTIVVLNRPTLGMDRMLEARGAADPAGDVVCITVRPDVRAYGPAVALRERLDALSRAELAGLVVVVVVTIAGAGLWYVRS